MDKGKKQWLKPGDLRTKKLTENEKQRNKRIKENCEVMNNLEVKNVTNSLVSAVHPKCANTKEKGIRVEVDDDDENKPSESGDDNDDESLGSFDREDQEMMPPGLRLQSHSRPLNPTPEEGTYPLCQDIGTQPLLPYNVQLEHEHHRHMVVARHTAYRPSALSIRMERCWFLYPEQFRAPVKEKASKLASKIGIEVRTQLPDLSVCRWKKVNNAEKEPMIPRLADQFDLLGNQSDVAKPLDIQFGSV